MSNLKKKKKKATLIETEKERWTPGTGEIRK